MEEGMSKRLLTMMVVATTLVGANNAFASRARIGVLGTSNVAGLIDRGSFFVDDNQNIFYNPAQINNFKNWAAVEKNNGSSDAEGGFATQVAGFNLGVYMNRGELTQPRPLDLFFGGDMGVKWGVGVTLAGERNGPDAGTTDLTLRAGADISGLEPFAAFKLIGKTSTVEGDADDVKVSDINVGARYKYGEWVPFAAWRQAGGKVGDGESTTAYSALGLGVGRNARVAEGVRLNYAVSVNRVMKNLVGGGLPATNSNIVPLDVSVEGDVTTWLVLRGGVSYQLVNRTANVTNTGDTTARMGASINVGKVGFDWAVGTGATENLDSETFGFADGFFSAASLNYRW